MSKQRDKPMIRCSTCQQLFHGGRYLLYNDIRWSTLLLDCVQCLPKPLLFGDNFGTFTCSICNDGTESYERKGLSWIIIVHLVIYNLIKKAQIEDSKKPEKDRREHYYFRWKEDVCAFIDDYWDYLLPDKQRKMNIYVKSPWFIYAASFFYRVRYLEQHHC